jgi:two-component system, LytTR family, sensor kinase
VIIHSRIKKYFAGIILHLYFIHHVLNRLINQMFFSNRFKILQSLRMQNIKKDFYVHSLIWFTLLLVSYSILKCFFSNAVFSFHVINSIPFIILYYINYSLLIPSFLLKGKRFFYCISSFVLLIVFLLTGYCLLNHSTRSALISQSFASPVNNYPVNAMFYNYAMMRNKLPDEVWFLLSINSFILFYSTGLASRFLQKLKTDNCKKRNMENAGNSAELLYLQQQINPHFILNTINNIYSLSITKSELVPDQLIKLSSIIRYTLYRPGNSIIKTTDELKIIDDYIQLQKLRLTEKVSVNYRLVHGPYEYPIEPLIILTLLENAFKYGTSTNSDSFIDIVLLIANQQLILRIRNKIAGQIQNDKKQGGIGLSNIKRRLELVYPGRYQYKVCITDMIYSVFLRIELDNELHSYRR